MATFLAPYLMASFTLDWLLRGVNYLLKTLIFPPWEKFLKENHIIKGDFAWYEFWYYSPFWMYYQVYFLLMLIFVAYVHWKVYNLQQIRYKAYDKVNKTQFMLMTRTSCPYTLEDLDNYEKREQKKKESPVDDE